MYQPLVMLICWVQSTPLTRFALFHPYLVVLPICLDSTFSYCCLKMKTSPETASSTQTACRSNDNYPTDSKAHHLPELSRMMDLRHTNSSPWRFIMRNRAAVASSMSKISTMPSTHFPWFLCEYHQGGHIHSFNLAVRAFHSLGPFPSNLVCQTSEDC